MDKEKYLIPNSTQVPNVLLDLFISQIPEAEARCILYIARRTYGFHKERDRISLSQFTDGIKNRDGEQLDYGTGLTKPSVIEGLRNLVGSGLVKSIRTSGGNYYEINLDLFENTSPDEVVKKVYQLRRFTRSSKEGLPKQVKLLYPQNKGNKGNKDIESLFNFWNKLNGLIKHYKLTSQMKTKISSALKEYSIDKIEEAMERYNIVLKDDKYFWTYKWGLPEFLGRGLTRFVDSPIDNFLKKGSGFKSEKKKHFYDGREVALSIRGQKVFIMYLDSGLQSGEWLELNDPKARDQFIEEAK